MIEANETYGKIINVLKERGPSLPINISKDIEMSSLFVSAFLSEMVNTKKIRVSHLKVGGSPLYFMEGQELQLENFSNYLHPREADAFLLLRNVKVLKDGEQEPAMRVALRSIRDFAVGFKKNDEIYWRYIFVSESEIRDLLNPKEEVVEKRVVVEEESKGKLIDEKKNVNVRDDLGLKENVSEEFNNPLVENRVEGKIEKPKSNFVQEVVDFINKKEFKIVEERDFKTKEYNAVVRVDSDLGFIDFLTQAKDKKIITESDLKKLLSNAQSIPLPAFFIYNGNVSKKAKEYLEKYGSILKSVQLLKQ